MPDRHTTTPADAAAWERLDGDGYEQRRVDGLAANEHAAWRD